MPETGLTIEDSPEENAVLPLPSTGVNAADRPSIFSAFSSIPFRWIWSAVLLAGSGQYIIMMVAGYEAYHLTGSPFWSSLVAMSLMLPNVLVGPFGGALADRHNRIVVMMGGMSAAALGCFLMVAVIALHLLNPYFVVASSAAAGIGMAIQNPSWQATLPGLLGRRMLVNAGLLSRIAMQGAEMVGPLVATWIMMQFGVGAAFAFAGSFYLLGVLFAAQIRSIPGARVFGGDRGVFTPIVRGAKYVLSEPMLRILMSFVLLHCVLTMAFTGLLPALASQHLGNSSSVYGVLLAGIGLGAVSGPLTMAALAGRLRPVPALFASGVLSGLSLVSLGFTTSFPLAVASAVIAGASQAVFMALIYALTQSIAIDSMRGRVASTQLLLTAGSMGVASFIWGTASAADVSVALLLTAPGLTFVVIVALYMVRFAGSLRTTAEAV